MKCFTLVLLCDNNRVLLGRKRRKFGAGFWNGFGGKIKDGESPMIGAIRETTEECGITPINMRTIGSLHFTVRTNHGDIEEGRVTVFTATPGHGILTESEEMRPLRWFTMDRLPYKEMFPDNAHWFPWALEGRPFHAEIVVDAPHTLVSCTVTGIPETKHLP